MALVSYTQPVAGQPVQFTMNKNELLSVPKVMADPFFSLESNWFRVSFVFKDVNSNRRFVPSFRNFNITKSLKIRNTMSNGDNFELKKIIISKADRTFLVIRTNEIPSVASYNFSIATSGEVTPPVVQGYRYIKLAVSKPMFNDQSTGVDTDAVRIGEIKARWNGGLHSLNSFNRTFIAPIWNDNWINAGWNEGPRFPDDITDGDYSTGFTFIPFSSGENPASVFKDILSIDLGQTRDIQSLELGVTGIWVPLEYKFYGSTNNTDWTELVSETEANVAGWRQKGNRKETFLSGKSMPTYRYVKFSIIRALPNSAVIQDHPQVTFQEFNLRFDNVTQANLSQFTATELAPPGFYYNSGQSWGNRTFSQIFDGQVINFGAGTEYGFEVTPGIERDLFKVDLSQPRFIQDIRLTAQNTGGEGSNLPREFKVYASNDQSNWTQIFYANDERWLLNTAQNQMTSTYEADYGPSSGFRFLKVAAANGVIHVSPSNEYFNQPRDIYEVMGFTVVKNGTLLRMSSITEATEPSPLNAQNGRSISTIINNQAVQGSGPAPYIFDRTSGVPGQFSDLFTVDIGRQIEFEEVRLVFNNGGWNNPLNYKIFGSRDGSSWQLIAEEVETVQSWPINGYNRTIKISPDMYNGSFVNKYFYDLFENGSFAVADWSKQLTVFQGGGVSGVTGQAIRKQPFSDFDITWKFDKQVIGDEAFFGFKNTVDTTSALTGFRMIGGTLYLVRPEGFVGSNISNLPTGNIYRMKRTGSTLEYYANGVLVATIQSSAPLFAAVRATTYNFMLASTTDNLA